jgi:uncharacterized metal-binding protein
VKRKGLHFPEEIKNMLFEILNKEREIACACCKVAGRHKVKKK